MQPVKPIYVVDDDNIFFFLLRASLQSLPFQGDVLQFRNGAEAMKQLDKVVAIPDQWPLLILLDLSMPVMSGWQFLSLYQRMSFAGKVPVYLLASSVNEGGMEQAKQFSTVAGQYIKPVSREELRGIIERDTV